MKRIILTAAASRFIEQQVSAYEDARDEKGKPLREPKERRQWDRIADLFSDGAGAYDKRIEELQSQGIKFGSAHFKEQSGEIERLLAAWRRQEPDPSLVSTATEALKSLFQLRLSAKERELNDAMQEAEDTLGTKECEIDIDDTQVDFLKRTWAELDLNTSRRTRKLVNQITDAFDSAAELVREGDKYVVKRKLSVVEPAAEAK